MLKILIVDDDEIVLLVQRKLLQRCGINHEVQTFKSGKNAIGFLEGLSSNNPVLLLLDINMPGMSGWQFLSRLREIEISEKVKVIIVTSSIDMYDKEAAGEYSNVIGFIEKPINIENCERIKSMPELKEYF